MAQYVALLRGINVGGNNLIKMADLKACFEAQGFGNVATYIQSGNVLFTSDDTDNDAGVPANAAALWLVPERPICYDRIQLDHNITRI